MQCYQSNVTTQFWKNMRLVQKKVSSKQVIHLIFCPLYYVSESNRTPRDWYMGCMVVPEGSLASNLEMQTSIAVTTTPSTTLGSTEDYMLWLILSPQYFNSVTMVSDTVFVDAITSTDLFIASKRLLLHLKQRWKLLSATNHATPTQMEVGLQSLTFRLTVHLSTMHCTYVGSRGKSKWLWRHRFKKNADITVAGLILHILSLYI